MRRFPSPARALGDALFSERWPVHPSWAGERVLDRGAYEREGECDWTSGSFMLACIATWFSERPPESRFHHPLWTIGFCGTYTTFSTMQLEIFVLLQHDRYALAAGYALASILAGYLAIRLGTQLVRHERREDV